MKFLLKVVCTHLNWFILSLSTDVQFKLLRHCASKQRTEHTLNTLNGTISLNHHLISFKILLEQDGTGAKIFFSERMHQWYFERDRIGKMVSCAQA